MMERNVLAIAHRHKVYKRYNRIFENWCHGIKANSDNYHFADYVDLYSKLGKKASEEYLSGLVQERKIDCVYIAFLSGDLTFDIRFLESLSKKAFIVMGFFDTEHYFEAIDRYYAQAADLVLLPDYMSQYRYRLLNVNALCTFSLFDKDSYKRLQGVRRDIDVSFIGDIGKSKRREFVSHLLENGIDLQCYGGNTEHGFAEFEDMVRFFNRTKVNINFTGVVDNRRLILGSVINNRIKQCKGRPVEIALCGGFVLTEYAPGIEYLFETGKEMDVFRNKNELYEKTRYYLEHDEERERIAQRGYERARKDYDAAAGFEKVFGAVDKAGKAGGTIYLDKEFIRNYTSYRFLYIVKFLLAGEIRKMFEELAIVARNRALSLKQVFLYGVQEFVMRVKYGRDGKGHRLYKVLKKVRKIFLSRSNDG